MRPCEILYLKFMEGICAKYKCKPVFSCLERGFKVFCESQDSIGRFNRGDFNEFHPKTLDWKRWIDDCVAVWKREWTWGEHGKRVPRYTAEQISYWHDKAVELYRYYLSLYSEYTQSNPGILDNDNTAVDWVLPLDYIANGTYPDSDEQEFSRAKELIAEFVNDAGQQESERKMQFH